MATLLPSGIHVRSVDQLHEVVNVVTLPSDLSPAGVVFFQWSPSSRRLLVATSDQILVAAALADADEEEEQQRGDGSQPPFRAVIRNPSLPVVAKPTYVGFGPDDDQVYLCSAFGIKFAVYNLQTGKTVEIANPKLFSSAAICSRGFSLRPGSHHLAILTRTAGKDWLSVHDPDSAAVIASWAPDTTDSQGIVWSPDGRWLAVWESPAHGHRLLFYTPDGHLFKTWTADSSGAKRIQSKLELAAAGLEGHDTYVNPSEAHKSEPAVEDSLGSGVRLVQFSANAQILAVGDASRSVRIFDMSPIVEYKRLLHPATLSPNATSSFKIWQEQIDLPSTSVPVDSSHVFVEAARNVSPPGRTNPTHFDATVVSSGCSHLAFDASSTLLVTRLEEAPSTVWVWNIDTGLLCAVLMLHASVSNAAWHPDSPQTLLVTCEGDKHRGLGILWNPDYDAPQVADFSRYYPVVANGNQPVPGSHPVGRHWPSWLKLDGVPPSLFYSDGKDFTLAALDEDTRYKNAGSLPWKEAAPPPIPSSFANLANQRWGLDERAREESPLELVPAGTISEDSDLEDTFHYKKDE